MSTSDLYVRNKNRRVFSPLELTNSDSRHSRFYLFTVEPLHLFRLGISKSLEKCTMGYLSVIDKKSVLFRQTGDEKMSSCKSQPLNRCNEFNSASQKEFSLLGLQVSFTSAPKSFELNGFLLPQA